MARGLLGAVALVAFLLFFHNYGCSILPSVRTTLRPALMQPVWKFSYTYPFDAGEPDVLANWRNRAEMSENGRPMRMNRSAEFEVRMDGRGRWLHEPGRIVFTTSDNSDPRSNGRTYAVSSPILYTQTIGRVAGGALLLALCGLYGLNRAPRAEGPRRDAAALTPPSGRWRRHLFGIALLFLAGLYANTGTLPPYANTYSPYVDTATGYLYNTDHPHFKVLFAFVDNAHKSVWNHALMLRRILFPVLGWPLMKAFGFEVGGTLASLALNTLGLVAFLAWLRRRVGERGATFAGWILALSPGATYWGGLPYPYALIFPSSLLLLAGMIELADAPAGWRPVLISAGMGVLYLGYDFAPFFLPASLILLIWKRRFGRAALSLPLQALPLGLWLWILSRLGQSFENSNTAVYHEVAAAIPQLTGPQLGAALVAAWDAGWNVFFGANFIFLPALFLVAVGLNPLTSRIRFLPAEVILLLTVLGIFLVNNLVPPYSGWDMHGSWASRLYQPVFAAFIVFLARWWQRLPPLSPGAAAAVRTAVIVAVAGNALIVFGPVLNNPLRISEFAFYRFYNHTQVHEIYDFSRQTYGRRPLGFRALRP